VKPTNKRLNSGAQAAPRRQAAKAAPIVAIARPWPGFVLAAILVVLAMAGGALLSFHWIYEPDLWWHLAQGREAAAGHLVKTNLFSATYPSYPQPFTSWLFELGVFGLYTLGGAIGIQTGQAVMVALTLALLYFACRRRSNLATVIVLETFGLFVIEPRVVPRPHLVSMVLMAACVLLVERARVSRSIVPLWPAIPLIALWSNVHAECFFGVALIGMFAAGEFIRPQTLNRRQAGLALAMGAACLVADLANPYGLGVFQYLWENARAREVVRIADLRPAYLPVYAPYFAYLVTGAGLLVWKWRKLALWEMFAFAAFAVLSLSHVRFLTLFFCVTAPIVAARLSYFVSQKANVPLLAGVALCAGLILSPLPLSIRFERLGIGSNYLEPPDMLSPAAITFVRSAGLKGPVFNSNNLGGYLIWNLYPDVRVFQDPRFQSYPPEFLAKIEDAYQSQSAWDELVTGVDWAVLSRAHYSGALSGAGRFPPEQWRLVYQDRSFFILVRRLGRYGTIAASPEHAG
jgi:hypothetical protein